MRRLTSHERFIRALENREVDNIPCCFMSFSVLRKRLNENLFELCKYEKKMGLDSMLFIPMTSRRNRPEHPDLRGLPVRFDEKVGYKEEIIAKCKSEKILRRIYFTPKGNLITEVRMSDDWPHSHHIPFIDDYQIPRSLKPLITEEEDLEALQFLLVPPIESDINEFMKEAKHAKEFSKNNDVILSGGWGVSLDMAMWLCGMDKLMLLAIDKPKFIDKLLDMIHKWNLERMKVIIASGIDLFIRRAWYEGCSFFMPEFYRKHILPGLKKEVEYAHENDVKFGYICTSGVIPMLDSYISAGIDVLIGIDPVQGVESNIRKIREISEDKLCLWGGVSGAVTIERGTEEEVRHEVHNSIVTLGPKGFILSPVDNITVDAPSTWKNIEILIDEWEKHC